MEFRILGPIEVVDEGRLISIRRGKQLALLAYLLLRANELVPSERLIDELWNENPPPTAAKVLQNAVSELRKALGEDRLLTRSPGYVLRVEAGELDLEQFELLARRGRAAADPELLRRALALWRGDALADLRDEPFAQRASAQLEEARLAAQADRLDADLAGGRHAELVPELEALLAKHPYDERLYRQLMLALYRAGRAADALAVYQRARKTFDEELGLQPGPELEQLQHRILNQDVELAAPERSGRGLTLARPPRRGALLVGAALVAGAGAAALVLVVSNGGGGVPRVTKDSLVKIDPETGDILDVVRVGRQPVAVAVLGDSVFVSNVEDATITRLDSKSGDIHTTGGLRPPLDLVPDGVRHLWTTTYGYEQITRIDARTLKADLVVPLGRRTFLLGTGAGSLWVTEPAANGGQPGSVGRIDLRTAKVERTVGVGPFPVDVKVGEGAAWVTNAGDASVSRISLVDLSVERIAVGGGPGPLAIAFGSVWIIAGQENDTVWRLNPETRQPDAVIQVGKGPFNVEADAYGVWAALRDAGTIVRIDPRSNTVTKRVHLGYKPQGMAVGAGALWVTVGHGELGPLG